MREARVSQLSLLVVIAGVLGTIGGDVSSVVGDTQNLNRLIANSEMRASPKADLQPVTSEEFTLVQRREAEFSRVRAVARATGSIRVIVQLDVPNVRGLTAASQAARGAAPVAALDGQLSAAIAGVRQVELAKLAGTPHTINRTYSSVPFVAMTVSEGALDVLRASPGVVGINEDRLAAPLLDNTVNITGASAAWTQGYDGTGWYVAILDTGIRASHDFFAGKNIVQACFASGNGGDCPNGSSTDTTSPDAARHFPSDGTFHGTHVAGIATGNDPTRVPPLYGVARGADIIAIQVFSEGLGSFDSDRVAAQEYLYALRTTYNIASANMSLGGGNFSDEAACDAANAAEKAAIDNLRGAGIAMAIATGNGGRCAAISAPGCISSAIGVGNTQDNDVEAFDSDYHPTLMDIYGPGSSILSAVGTSDSSYNGTYSGTSMATPHVAGAWAILKQAVPTADVTRIFDALHTSGDPVTGRCTASPPQRRIQIELALEALGAGQIKSSQPPDNSGQAVESDVDLSDMSPNAVRADDFVSDGRAISGIRWWGSNLSTGNPSAASAQAQAPDRRKPALRETGASIPAYTESELAHMVAEKARQDAGRPAPAPNPPDQPLVGGDTCETATVIPSLPYADSGDSCAGTNNYDPGITGASCPFSGSTADDVVYSYTPGSNVNVEISLCGNSAYDTKVYVYENLPCSGATPDNRCNDDTCTTPSFIDPWVSRLSSVSMTSGNTYYIIVDGYLTACGNYTLSVLSIVCGDSIVSGSEECDPPNGTTCNSSCQFITCGDGLVEGLEQCDPPNAITCDNNCQLIDNPPIDGWLISFHEPLAKSPSIAEPLGLYFCDASLVSVRATTFTSCDFRQVREYFVVLEECCLLAANVDSRNSLVPAQPDGFHEEECFDYDIDIQAVMGYTYVLSGGCVPTPTLNSATIPYWGWHTTGVSHGNHLALGSTVATSGLDWLYGPWANFTPTCSGQNMAYQLLTQENATTGDCDNDGIPDACDSGPDCQPNGTFDQCDIAAGTSQDCQPNTIPDECDIRDCAPNDLACQDCQLDGVPDSCQLSGNDTNGNGKPDECDPSPPQSSCQSDKNRSLGLIIAGTGTATGPVYQTDDGSAEDSIGVGDGAGGGRTFGWANRFTNTTGAPITLAEIDVAFGNPIGGTGVSPGDAVDAVIWIDAAATGTLLNATKKLRWSLPGGVHAGDGTFATHFIPCGGVTIPTGADFYVGCGDIQTSIDSLARFPAAIDDGASAVRSWAFFNPTQNVFNPDNFTGQNVGTIDSFGLPGNWLIRAQAAAAPSATAAAVPTALRVKMIELQNPVPPNLPQFPPPDFSAYEAGGTCTDPSGCVRWVGPTRTFLESQDTPLTGSFRAARLQCTAHYQDWTTEGVFFVAGAEIVPSSKYDVQSYALTCMNVEETCLDVSPPIRLTTARSGDVEAPFNPPSTSTQPNAIDVTQLVNKFKNATGALPKAVAQLQPNLPELNADINALDIVAVVDAVKQFAYAFSGPCPCPSTVTCDTTPCATPSVCVTTYGAGALCVKTCTGGDNLGLPCINNSHCPGGSCSNGFCRDRCGRCSSP